MGSENLHHKRKKRSSASFERIVTERNTYETVLIVCEGEKTESYYLRALCDSLRLSTASIQIVGLGADPLSIVNSAVEKFNTTRDYDRVYCIFDKDQHANYQKAIDKVENLRNQAKNIMPIYSITSIPCFEYWILLHFVDTARPYNSTGKKTSGELLFNAVKLHIKDYHKGHKKIFEISKPYLQDAIVRAKKNYKQQKKVGTDNPSTNMFELIEYLFSLNVIPQ